MINAKTKIRVYGSGCPSCKRLFERTTKAVEELGLDAETEYITDLQKLMDLGVMQSPVMTVDGELAIVGYVPDVEAIKETIQAALRK